MNRTFRIVPLPTAVATNARRVVKTGTPDHQIVTADSPGAMPCRHCLRWAEPGESMVLFPYQAIPAHRPYGECGPIFVHQNSCGRYSATDEYPAAFRDGRVVRAYNARSEIIGAQAAENEAEPVLEAMLANPKVSFLHVRSLTHGCYTLRVERA